jgi:parallel beta-helix repeat protein/predicted outer membrane repeat protein
MKRTQNTKKLFLIFLFSLFPIFLEAGNKVVTNINDSGIGSLRETLMSAVDGDTITFNMEYTSAAPTVELLSPILINKSISIDGNNHGNHIIIKQTDSNSRVLTVQSTNTTQQIHVRIENITISDGTDGGIFVDKNVSLQLHHCTISNNSMYGGEWGGIYISDHSSLLVNDCLITKNRSSYGGGIRGQNADVVVKNSIFSNNSSTFYPAAITMMGGGNLLIEDSEIRDNVKGIGIYSGASMIMRRCLVDNNVHTGGGDGGGVRISSNNTVLIEDSYFTNNLAGNGGGIYSLDASLTIKNCVIRNNKGISWAGGIISYGPLRMDSCLIESNEGYNAGGGMICYGGPDYRGNRYEVRITNTTIRNNKVTNLWDYKDGGGAMFYGQFQMENCTISGNTAPIGGGLTIGNDTAILINNTITGNTAYKYGGGISILHALYDNVKPTAILINNTICNNLANEFAGGVYYTTGNTSGIGTAYFYNNLIAYNSFDDIHKDTKSGEYGFLKGNMNIGKTLGISDDEVQCTSYDISTPLFENNQPILANYGGFTETVAISENSIARSAGIASVPDFTIPQYDQRGIRISNVTFA